MLWDSRIGLEGVANRGDFDLNQHAKHSGKSLSYYIVLRHHFTVRERDSMNQIRVPIKGLQTTLAAKLSGEDLFVLPPGGQIWKVEKGG